MPATSAARTGVMPASSNTAQPARRNRDIAWLVPVAALLIAAPPAAADYTTTTNSDTGSIANHADSGGN